MTDDLRQHLRTLDLIQDEHDEQPQHFRANHDLHAPRLLETAQTLRAELDRTRAELDRLRQERAANRSAPGSAGERIEAIAFDLATGSRVVPPDELYAAIAAHRDDCRAAGMREAAAMLRRYCPTHSTADTCLMDCHCAGADEIDRDARAVSTPTDGCGCKTDVHPGHYPSCPTRDAAPSAPTT
ncbi:hypothetical protein [Kitasatospora camelliae]|uniref:Uncharacterized protein n=1 Tax=Kitasatospora camelliae TaxID=3156397 RepID=A0AAU8K6V9_9ACTN